MDIYIWGMMVIFIYDGDDQTRNPPKSESPAGNGFVFWFAEQVVQSGAPDF